MDGGKGPQRPRYAFWERQLGPLAKTQIQKPCNTVRHELEWAVRKALALRSGSALRGANRHIDLDTKPASSKAGTVKSVVDTMEDTPRLTEMENYGYPVQTAPVEMAERQNNVESDRRGFQSLIQLYELVYNSPNLSKSPLFHLSNGIFLGSPSALRHWNIVNSQCSF